RTIKNVRANGRMAIEVLGDDLCYGLRGTAVIEKETMTSAPFPCALVALKVEDVRDHGAAGVKFVGPTYSSHEAKEHRRGVEAARGELRKATEELKARSAQLTETRDKLTESRKKAQEAKGGKTQSRGVREAELEEDLAHARKLTEEAHGAESAARRELQAARGAEAQAKAEL